MDSKKKIIIFNKFYQINEHTNKTYFHNSGDSMNIEHVSGIIDDNFMCHINIKNRFIWFLMSYFFYNCDFKKQRSFDHSKVNRFRFLNQWLLWISIIGLIICLIFGVAIPIFNSVSNSLQLMNGSYLGSVIANGKVIGWVTNQSNMISFIKTLSDQIENITSWEQITNDTNLTWFRFFIENYWAKKYSFGEQYFNAFINFKDFVATHLFSDFSFLIFDTNFQVLAYFKLVGETFLTSQFDLMEMQTIFNSFDGQLFTLLSRDNVFYGLHAQNICLSDDRSSQTMIIPQIWNAWFSSSIVIVPLCFTLIFILIIFLNLYILRKNKNKYNAMSIFDYVSQKNRFAKKMHWFLSRFVFLETKTPELKHNLLFNIDTILKSDYYSVLRLLNYVYSVVESVSIVLVLDYDETTKQNLEILFSYELKHLQLSVVSQHKINQWIQYDVNSSTNSVKNIVEQYQNYLVYELEKWNNLNELKSLNKSFSKMFKHIKITKQQQEEIVKNFSVILKKYKFSHETLNLTTIFLRTKNKQLLEIIKKIIANEKQV